jgi:hypothetical protein
LSTFYPGVYFLIRHWIKTMRVEDFALPLSVPNLRLGCSVMGGGTNSATGVL